MAETIASIEEMARAGETAAVEFKTGLPDARRLAETAAGMATTGGGTILLGISDDGRVKGTSIGKGEIERLVQQLHAAIDPRLYVDVDRVEVAPGRDVVVLRIPAGDGPHLANGRAFYRSGPVTVAMTRDEYERRLLDRLRESSGFERQVDVEVPWAAIDEAAVSSFGVVARARGLDAGPAGTDETLARLNLCSGGKLRVGGTLLFARAPQIWHPQALIRARSLRARAPVGEISVSIEGNLPNQIEAAVAFVMRHVDVRSDRTAIVRRDSAELPQAAVREVIANAIAHRDYRSTAPTQLVIDDAALEVWNPGHLPSPLTATSLRERHPSIPPNPLIARVLYLLGYIEEWGTGTTRVIEEMRSNQNPEPVFEEVDHAGLRVVLPLKGRAHPHISDRQARALANLRSWGTFSSGKYANWAGVSLRAAQTDLRALEIFGLVRRKGAGRSQVWETIG